MLRKRIFSLFTNMELVLKYLLKEHRFILTCDDTKKRYNINVNLCNTKLYHKFYRDINYMYTERVSSSDKNIELYLIISL